MEMTLVYCDNCNKVYHPDDVEAIAAPTDEYGRPICPDDEACPHCGSYDIMEYGRKDLDNLVQDLVDAAPENKKYLGDVLWALFDYIEEV